MTLHKSCSAGCREGSFSLADADVMVLVETFEEDAVAEEEEVEEEDDEEKNSDDDEESDQMLVSGGTKKTGTLFCKLFIGMLGFDNFVSH